MTKERMEKLIKQARNWTLCLGMDVIGGVGGGSTLTLVSPWLLSLATSTDWTVTHAFWHEFSHCMGWSHEAGNMCNLELPDPWGKQCWPSIASRLYVEELKKGNPPYIEDRNRFFNNNLFSKEHFVASKNELDEIKDGTLYIGEGMSYIESFQKNTDFTKVVIPSSVEVISGSAFSDTRLDEITIPSTVTKINGSAFFGCLALKEITIPDTVKSIGDSAFQNCTSLTSVKIGSGLRQLNKEIFKKASALAEITIPGTVKYIGNAAFQDCRNLSKVVISDGVRKIGDNAFGGTALTEITIPASVTMIGKNITSKNVIWNVKEGTYAYQFALENKYMIKQDNGSLAQNASRILAESKNAEAAPTDVWQKGTFTSKDVRRRWDFSSFLNGTDGGDYVITFTYTSGAHMLCLTDALFTADGKAIAYFPEQRTAGASPQEIFYAVEVPAGTKKLELYALVRGGGGNNSNGTITVKNAGLKKLTVPATTETIKDSFYFGSKYEEVVLPSGLKKIGSMAFQDSTELKSITIPDSVTDIGSAAFQNCPSLTSAKIGSGLTKINYRLFKNSGLTQITIPGTIGTIGDEAFQFCEKLKSVTIQYGVTSIGQSAFAGSALTEVTIPASVTNVGKQAFQNCTSLASVKIGSGLTTLSKSLFQNSGLTSVTIPRTVETIGENAFADCANLKTVTIQYGVKEIARSAFARTVLTSINIPESVTKIGVRAFDTSAITKVTLPSSLVELSTCAFIDSALTEVTIPGTLKKIDVKAFQGCANLTKVVIKEGVEEICEKAFWNTGIKEIKIPTSVKSIGLKIVPEDAVWDVEVGSYAYEFALENNMKIKATDAVLKDKTARLLADKSIESAPADKWVKDTFTKNDVRRKWDFSSSLKGGGTYTITFKYTSGAHKLSLTDSLFVADGKPVAYYPETLSAGANPKSFVFTVEVPAGTRKLELYALAKGGGGSDSNGTITVEKK